jgi:hypothetical protein
MDAAADYAAAKVLLARPLPAYVSYTVHSHVKFDAIVRDETSNVVVRTADGTIVKGKVPEAGGSVHIGTGESGMEPIKHPAFRAACYDATSAQMQRYQGRELEALTLHSSCTKSPGDKDFDRLYVEPRTHEPIAAVGSPNDDHVVVRLAQEFTQVGDRALPASLYARVQGSGLMFWLDVLVDQHYDDYRFSATPP